MKQLLVALLLAGSFLPSSIAADGSDQVPPPKIKVGDIAPDFTLEDQNGKQISLHEFRGKKNVALAFYIFAFTGGWAKQMQAFQQNLSKLEAADTQVLGVSMDSPFSNKAWAQQIGVTFPLLSDWGGDITKKYGLYDPEYKAARRVNYVIDKEGKVIEMQLDDDAIDPSKVVVACQAKKLNR
jgi:peroxiredoxin